MFINKTDNVILDIFLNLICNSILIYKCKQGGHPITTRATLYTAFANIKNVAYFKGFQKIFIFLAKSNL